MTPARTAWRLAGESLAAPVQLSLAAVSTIVLGLAQLYLTWLVKEWIEGPFVSGELRALSPILVGAALALFVSVAALFCSRYLIAAVNQSTLERLRNRAIERLLSLDVSGARRFPSGDVMSRLLNDASLLSNFLNTMVRRVVRESLVVAGALTMLFVLEWRWALALTLLVPVAGLLLVGFGSVIRRWGTRAQRAMGSLGGTLSEQLQGFTTIKGYQAESFEAGRFAAANASFRHRVMRAEYWSTLLLSSMFLLVGFGVLAVIYYGNLELASGAVSRGTLVAFCLYAAQIVEPIRRLSEVHAALQTTLAAAARVYELIDLPAAEQEGKRRVPDPPRGEIRFDRVSFGYGQEDTVLRSVSFSIGSREQVALVGATGAGKSTVAGLLVRFFTPEDGVIRLDGIECGELSVADIRRAVCVVEQGPFLFSGPLIDNIRYGSWDAPRQRVDEAIGLAGLEPLLAALPGGADSPVEESGRDLSGGEKQRIALARAIVRDPAVLVLDEATSAIDSQTEALIFDGLRQWMARRTVVAITHRLAMAIRFPRCIVLDGGRVAGDGAPEALLKTCPAFAGLFREQLDPLDINRGSRL